MSTNNNNNIKKEKLLKETGCILPLFSSFKTYPCPARRSARVASDRFDDFTADTPALETTVAALVIADAMVLIGFVCEE